MYKSTALLVLILLKLNFLFAQHTQVQKGAVSLSFSLIEGKPYYSVSLGARPIIKQSALGFILDNKIELASGFSLVSIDSSTSSTTWQPVLGEVKEITDDHKELAVHLKQNSSSIEMVLRFRVFADGIGFRYEFPNQPNLKYFIVKEECTQFALAGNHKAFWIPGDFDTNEYMYTTTSISEINNRAAVKEHGEIALRRVPDSLSVQSPLLMKSAEGTYIQIFEANLHNYPAMHLQVNPQALSFTSALVPDANGNKAYLRTPFHTPWRTIIASQKATDILASKTILNLNDPCAIENTSWIKPMKFVGPWWELQRGISSWNYTDNIDKKDANGRLIPNQTHGARNENVKKYIDFAAKHGIDGVLVEGWNTGWEEWFDLWREDVFSFVTPYPDFDVQALNAYAKQKGVSLVMHHETAGSVTSYERQMDTAYRFMKAHGYPAVKTGYVGRINPRSEFHDGQSMVNHYDRVAKATAANQIMVDMHEPVRPTGQSRTYPNWIANEAARGNEFNAFSRGNPPEHETILPFTRLAGGPMDYTPGIFSMKKLVKWDTSHCVHTTLVKQLALYVVMYSPLQMAADLPENYEKYPDAFQFIKDVGLDWDNTWILAAEPGDFIATARKQKGADKWFVGAITDENERTMMIDFSFLPAGKKYIATIYADAADAHWYHNPEAYIIKKQTITSTTKMPVRLAAGGGVAISIL